jgi:hypothetical protein
MRRSSVAIGLFIAVMIGGCSTIPVNDSPNGPTCKAVAFLAAFFNSTVNCTAVANTTTATNTSAVQITGSSTDLVAAGSAAAVVISVGINRTGAMQTGTWTNTTPGMSGSISVTNGDSTWITTTNTGTNQGTFTMTLTKVTLLTTTANGPAYLVDGTLDATVPAVTTTGATGTVTLHIDFTNN